MLKTGDGGHHQLANEESLRGLFRDHVEDFFGRWRDERSADVFVTVIQFRTNVVQGDALISQPLPF